MDTRRELLVLALAGGASSLTGQAKAEALQVGPTAVAPSVASLRQLADASARRVDLLGYYAPGDGGGGALYRDLADGATRDNGVNVFVDATGGRWKRPWTGVINALEAGARGDASSDDAPAIQAAINALGSRGGEVVLPPRKYVLRSGLVIGAGSAAQGPPGWSRSAGVTLKGLGSAAGIGPFNPVGGAAFIYSGAGPAITVAGPIGGWAIEDLFLAMDSAGPEAIGIALLEAQFGRVRNVAIDGCAGVSLLLSTRGHNNTTANRIEEVFIYLPPAGKNAVGVRLSGKDEANAAFNTFDGLHIIPSNPGQIGAWLEYCDSNQFERMDVEPTSPPCTALLFDYSAHGGDFPSGNRFGLLDPYDNKIATVGSESALSALAPNRITGFSQVNGAPVPYRLPGVSVERIRLNGPATFYVAPSGSDRTGTGLVQANPLGSLQHAVDLIKDSYDFGGFSVTLKLAPGIHMGGVRLSEPVMSGRLIIDGEAAAPSSVIIRAVGDAVTAENGATLVIRNCQVVSDRGSALVADAGGRIRHAGCVFGGAAQSQLSARRRGEIIADGAYMISGGGMRHMEADSGGVISSDGMSVTVNGSPAYMDAFATARSGGIISMRGGHFSGQAYGAKFAVGSGGVIDTGGGRLDDLPGDRAGRAG